MLHRPCRHTQDAIQRPPLQDVSGRLWDGHQVLVEPDGPSPAGPTGLRVSLRICKVVANFPGSRYVSPDTHDAVYSGQHHPPVQGVFFGSDSRANRARALELWQRTQGQPREQHRGVPGARFRRRSDGFL